MANYYAGIGSRETPADVLRTMKICASKLEKGIIIPSTPRERRYILRSGGAKGADSAFEAGVIARQKKEIFIASDCTAEAEALSAEFHPYWDNLNQWVRYLMGRNVMILLGRDLKTPVDFVMCWTPGARVTGGTGHGLRVAKHFGIQVFNMANPHWKDQVKEWKAQQ